MEENQDYALALKTVKNLVDELSGLCQTIANAEIELESMKRRTQDIQNSRLPDLLHELGYSDMRLEDGRRLELKTSIQASIPSLGALAKEKDGRVRMEKAERREQALAWLRTHGLGDLIKNELSTRFATGQDDKAREAQMALTALGCLSDLEETVNTATLKAQIKDFVASGEDFPLDLFNGYIFETVTIK